MLQVKQVHLLMTWPLLTQSGTCNALVLCLSGEMNFSDTYSNKLNLITYSVNLLLVEWYYEQEAEWAARY